MAHHGIEVRSHGPYEGGYRWVLKNCPVNAEHGGSAAIFRNASGKLGFKCQHVSCAGYDWHKLLEFLDGPQAARLNGTGPPRRGPSQQVVQPPKVLSVAETKQSD